VLTHVVEPQGLLLLVDVPEQAFALRKVADALFFRLRDAEREELLDLPVFAEDAEGRVLGRRALPHLAQEGPESRLDVLFRAGAVHQLGEGRHVLLAPPRRSGETLEFSAAPLACMAGHMHRKPGRHEPAGRQEAGPNPHRRHQARASSGAPGGYGDDPERTKKTGGQSPAALVLAAVGSAALALRPAGRP
jgi:hypothetical protein